MNDGPLGFREAAAVLPLVAILRGLAPARAEGVVRALVEAGFRIIEVPLNRDGAMDALRLAVNVAPPAVVVGAGTVLTRAQAQAVHDAGAGLIVMPHLDPDVVDEGRRLGLAVMPGVMTPTDAIAAIDLNVDALKLFPAEVVGPLGLKALRGVVPPARAAIYAVGGVAPETMQQWYDAGADGFGIGGSLFRPEFDDEAVSSRAEAYVAAWKTLRRTNR